MKRLYQTVRSEALFTQTDACSNALADLGGMPGTCRPYGTQFFCFCIHFWWKVPTLEVHAPLMGPQPPHGTQFFIFAYIFGEKHLCWRSTPPLIGPRPLREILDPPLKWSFTVCTNSKCIHVSIAHTMQLHANTILISIVTDYWLQKHSYACKVLCIINKLYRTILLLMFPRN